MNVTCSWHQSSVSLYLCFQLLLRPVQIQYSFIYFHVSLSSSVVLPAQGRYAHKLLNDLMDNYSNALRPIEDTDRALNVTLKITLSQIKDMVDTHTHKHTQPYLPIIVGTVNSLNNNCR